MIVRFPQKIVDWFIANSARITIALLAIVATVIVASIISNYYTHNKDDEYNAQRKSLMDSVIYYKSKTGQIIAKTQEITKYESNPLERKEIDSLRKLLYLKNKEVDTYTKIISEANYGYSANTQTREIIRIKDSFPAYRYIYVSPHLKYDAIASRDSLKFSLLQTTDSIYILTTKKNIGKKEYKELNIFNSNPYASITGVHSISLPIQKEYSKISIGLHAGMDVFSRKPVLSVGINYDIIRIKKKIK